MLTVCTQTGTHGWTVDFHRDSASTGVLRFSQGDGMGQPSRIEVRLSGPGAPPWVGGRFRNVKDGCVGGSQLALAREALAEKRAEGD